MSVETELWTREDGELARLLPRADDWDQVGGGVFEFDGDGWLVTLAAPEPAAAEDVPPELAAVVDGLRFRVGLGVEPSGAPREAWAFVGEIMERLGRALQGAGLDPESGHVLSWVS